MNYFVSHVPKDHYYYVHNTRCLVCSGRQLFLFVTISIKQKQFYSVKSCNDEADVGRAIHPGPVDYRFVSFPELVSKSIAIFYFVPPLLLYYCK